MHSFPYAACGMLLALATSSMACAADDDSRPEAPEVSSQSTVVGCCGATASDPNVDGLRLSLSWSDGGSEGNVGNGVYLAPYTSAAISLFDGSNWVTRIASTTAPDTAPSAFWLTENTTYDIFAYWSGTDVRLEAIPWTSETGSGLAAQDGVEVKPNDPTRRFVGAVATGPGSSISDVYHTRHIWNRYNRIAHEVRISPIPIGAQQGVVAYDWTYTNPNNVWRSASNDGFLPIKVLVGGRFMHQSYVSVSAQSMAYTSAGTGWFATGIGIDSATVNSAQVGDLALALNYTNGWGHTTAYYEGFLDPGKHTIRWLETGSGTSMTYTFLGHSRSSPFGKTGLVGWIMM